MIKNVNEKKKNILNQKGLKKNKWIKKINSIIKKDFVHMKQKKY